jgi:hypothetical protein
MASAGCELKRLIPKRVKTATTLHAASFKDFANHTISNPGFRGATIDEAPPRAWAVVMRIAFNRSDVCDAIARSPELAQKKWVLLSSIDSTGDARDCIYDYSTLVKLCDADCDLCASLRHLASMVHGFERTKVDDVPKESEVKGHVVRPWMPLRLYANTVERILVTAQHAPASRAPPPQRSRRE